MSKLPKNRLRSKPGRKAGHNLGEPKEAKPRSVQPARAEEVLAERHLPGGIHLIQCGGGFRVLRK